MFELLRLYQQSKMRFDYILTEKLLHIPKRGLLMAQRSSPLFTPFLLWDLEIILLFLVLCGSRKYPYHPQRSDWKFLGGGGFSKAQNLKLMYKALVEFPERWASGGLRKNPFRGGGMDIFWNQTLTLLVPIISTHKFSQLISFTFLEKLDERIC